MKRGAWEFDGNELVGPYGIRIPLKDIVSWWTSTNTGNQYLRTEKWRGWRVVQQFLVPPGRTIRTCPIHISHLKSLAYRIEHGMNEHAGLKAQTVKERFGG